MSNTDCWGCMYDVPTRWSRLMCTGCTKNLKGGTDRYCKKYYSTSISTPGKGRNSDVRIKKRF